MPQDETSPQHPTRRPARPEFGQYDEAHRDGRIPDEELARLREREERRRLDAETEARERSNASAEPGTEQRHDGMTSGAAPWTGRPDATGGAGEPLRYRPPQDRGADAWADPASARPGRGPARLAAWAAVLGSLGLVLSIFTVPVLLGIAGLACGIVALVRSRRTKAGRGLAIVGIVTGLLSVAVTAVLVVSAWSMLVEHCGSPVGQDPAAWQQCGYGMVEDLQQGR